MSEIGQMVLNALKALDKIQNDSHESAEVRTKAALGILNFRTTNPYVDLLPIKSEAAAPADLESGE